MNPTTPAGYVIVAATGGLNSDMNPVGFRQHTNLAYHGLRHIPGRGPYPLQDSFYARGFGTGVRHRGAAVVVQVTSRSTYTPPTIKTQDGRCQAESATRDPHKHYRDASEFGFGPGLVRPGRDTAPPRDGGIYRGVCPAVELTPSDDLSVRVRERRPRRGEPPRGYRGERIG